MGSTQGNIEKKFDVIYYSYKKSEGFKFSHKYSEVWGKSDFYCPRCAKKEVWCNSDGGDYYFSEEHICTACMVSFYLPVGVTPLSKDKYGQDAQRLSNLISEDV